MDKNILSKTLRGSSPTDIEEETGVPAIDVAKRVKDILATRDVFSDIEQRRLNIYGLQDLYDRAVRVLDDMNNEKTGEAAKMIDSVTRLLLAIDQLQSAQTKISDAEIQAAAAAQAAQILRFVQASYQRARDLLSEEYPEVDIESIDQAFQAGLREVTSSE